ncbi:uncharacterized protein LOC116100012 [Mastomys coucha]|uniref:uncharacterized protein LOC116100012 n=1 Tax=Mastomys coucha TaxID=35658 RepID=UPI001261D9CE|nr:uncharacterized protein LOC116100012 [Mastomys coucha]
MPEIVYLCHSTSLAANMSNEQVTYAELNVAKNSRNQHRKPRGTRGSLSVIEQEIIYADFSFQNPSQEHPRICKDCHCKGFPSPPEKLIAGTLGIICFVLIVSVVVITTSYTGTNAQTNSSKARTHRDINHNLSSVQSCAHCPKEWISYFHNCYYIGVEKKSWNDSLMSCISKNCHLLHIDSEEEQAFLQSLSLVSWTGFFRKSRGQPWVWKNDSTFKPKIAEILHDEYNCIMMSASGLTADNCTTLHTYLCKCKFLLSHIEPNFHGFPPIITLLAVVVAVNPAIHDSINDSDILRNASLRRPIASGCVASSIGSPQHRTQVELPQSPELISLTGLQAGDMSHLLGTERASEPRKVVKKTQSQLRFSNRAGDHLLEFSLQDASQKYLKASRHSYCKNFASPPEKLIAGILGIVWFALLTALVISTRIGSPYFKFLKNEFNSPDPELKKQTHSSLMRTQKDINHNLSSVQSCTHCPKEWISYSHSCYYIGVEKKSWNDSLMSCISKNCSLLHLDSEEEQAFLQSLSLVSWTVFFRKSRGQPWVWKNDSTFKPKIAEILHDEYNCIMMSASGLTADNCTTLHTYLCKCKFAN